MPVNTNHRAYGDARVQWDRCRDVYAGSDAVKKKTVSYLPLLEGHTQVNLGPYTGYIARAMFYPALSRTIGGLTGLVFAKPSTVSNVPKVWESHFEDVTFTGLSLGAYALKLCNEVLTTGRVGTLVDVSAEENGRPYWVMYQAENIINWRVSRIRGRMMLTLVVLEEQEEEDATDVFQPKSVRQFRVLELINGIYTVSIWRENKERQGQWDVWSTFVPLRRGTFMDYIPFAFMGPTSVSPAIDHPPLLDLVDVNLSHFRTSADQEHGAHFTALPTPYVTGHVLNQGESLAVGAGTAWVLPNADAKAGMVEFSGAGLKALAELKEEKRLLMATLGARMLETQKNTQEAAQTVRMRHAGERSALSVVADVLGQHVSQCLAWHLFWVGMEQTSADKAKIKFNPDAMDELSAEDMKALVATWQAGAISHKTVYHNLQWGEWARPNVTFEEELADIEAENEEAMLKAQEMMERTGVIPPPAPGQPPKPGQPPQPGPGPQPPQPEPRGGAQ